MVPTTCRNLALLVLVGGLLSYVLSLSDKAHSAPATPMVPTQKGAPGGSPSGKVAYIDGHGELRERNLANGETSSIGSFSNLKGLRGSSKGDILAISYITQLRYSDGRTVRLPFDCASQWAAISQDGKTVICRTGRPLEAPHIHIVEAIGPHGHQTFGFDARFEFGEFTPDGRFLFILPEGGTVAGVVLTQGVYMFTQDFSQIAPVSIPIPLTDGGFYHSIRVNTKGEMLLQYRSRHYLMALDLADSRPVSVRGKPKLVTFGSEPPPRNVSFSPDGNWVVGSGGACAYSLCTMFIAPLDGRKATKIKDGNLGLTMQERAVWY